MSLRTGETFAGYRILRLLGSGGMGEVYLVQHPRLPRQDALKVLRPDVSSDPSFQERFIREADLAAGLRHPHIVGIHDRGDYNGQLWISMDYIDGTDTAHLLRQRYPVGMPSELAIPIVTAIASALDYAHKKGLLHRDVKPANIIVADLDSDDQSVFLADFGIARPLDDTHGITATNTTVGTVAYAAPEQLMGEQMDGRADQYALAATSYQLLTGAELFTHSNPAVVISRHLNSSPPALAHHRPELAALDEALQTALAKEPDDRYPSCATFASALTDMGVSTSSQRTTASPPVAEKRPAPSATKEFTTRRSLQPIEVPEPKPRWPLIVSTLAIIVLLAVVAVALVVRPSPHDRASNGVTDISPTTTATNSAPVTSTTATTPSDFAYQPLWPFADEQEADRWLREDASRGISPWHADPKATALNFTRNYLDFSELDRVIDVDEQGEEAWVKVGYRLPEGEDATAATIHLVRYGSRPNAAWEVVGTEDDMLTVTAPAYGSSVGPVVYAGGAITGVDEAVHVQVRQSTQQAVLGEFCCVQTGGNPGSWSAQVRVNGARPGALTLVVWTGGHVARVEQFAITGLQAG